MGRGCYYLENLTDQTFITPAGDFKKFHGAKSKHGNWIAFLMITLSLAMVIYYFHMRRILHRFFSTSLKKQKFKINLLFAVFMISYSLKAILAPLSPYTNQIVCQIEIRWIVLSFIKAFFIYLPILFMLAFHHTSFR